MYSMYTVTAVAELTGLTPETLRAWERRHQVVAPDRDAAGRRVYDTAAVERLARLKRLTDAGHAIRRLAGLDDAALAELDRETAGAASVAAATPLDALRARLLGAVREYRADDFDRALGLSLATVEIPSLVHHVLAPLLHEVGRLWADGQIDIAQERLLSSALKTRALALINQRERVAQPMLLLATLSGERHELGLLLVALLAQFARVPFEYLGADLPPAEIARTARHLNPRVVALSLVHSAQNDGTAQVGLLRRLLPATTALWVGGAGAGEIDVGADDITVFSDVAQAERALRQLSAAQRTGAGLAS
jgi:MerR family transcriptional regulator, light-induced transcriptional regulator